MAIFTLDGDIELIDSEVGFRGDICNKGSPDVAPRSGLQLQSRTTYPDAWLPTLAAGPGQPYSRVSLENNRTPGISKGNRWGTEGHGRSVGVGGDDRVQEEASSTVPSTLSPLSPEAPDAPCGQNEVRAWCCLKGRHTPPSHIVWYSPQLRFSCGQTPAQEPDTWQAATLLLTADPGGPGGPNGPGDPSLPGGPARPYQKNEATEAEGD